MFKIIILLLCMTLALPGLSQSASFECKYKSTSWSSLGTFYYCDVQNSVTITSIDAAQIDSVTGTHLTGYNNDNVEVFYVFGIGQIHFFPRGLNKIFKNLKGIYIYFTGLKEIHQSDLKHFLNLKVLSLSGNSLEILENDLFEFNPDLEDIYLYSNKISHIDPNVFDKLTKLKTLYLSSNACIDMDAYNNSTAVQNVITTAKNQCTTSDYSNLEQNVKNLEAESSALSSEQLKEKLEKLENEVKNSKFPNFFQSKLQGLKADQAKKAQEEATTTTTTTEPTTTTQAATTESSKFETCSALESKVDKITENLTDLMTLATNGTDTQQCAALINENFTKMSQNIAKIDEKLNGTAAQVINSQFDALKDDLRNRNEDMDTKLEILDENVQNTKTAMLREIQNIKNAATIDHAGLLSSLRFRTDKIEKAIKEQDRKFDDQVRKMDELDQKLSKIMKALNIHE
ncbi:putative leucine-rich repeat-containing protein DDB_G0290503 [Chironomus tepperi]|uniref:putative leucine-rich repeat-containing protein DDB_G0290503 n=1 Tax=Chironomus tepperi TaxID=113505 RepID=UPI00391F36EA